MQFVFFLNYCLCYSVAGYFIIISVIFYHPSTSFKLHITSYLFLFNLSLIKNYYYYFIYYLLYIFLYYNILYIIRNKHNLYVIKNNYIYILYLYIIYLIMMILYVWIPLVFIISNLTNLQVESISKHKQLWCSYFTNIRNVLWMFSCDDIRT